MAATQGQVSEIQLIVDGNPLKSFSDPQPSAAGMSKAQLDINVSVVTVVVTPTVGDSDSHVAISNIEAKASGDGSTFSQEIKLEPGFNTLSVNSIGKDGELQYFVQIIRGDTTAYATAFTISSLYSMSPSFSPNELNYDVTLSSSASGFQVATFTAYPDEFTIYVEDTQVGNAAFSQVVALPKAPGKRKSVALRLEQGGQTTTYTFNCTRKIHSGTSIGAVKIFPAFGVGRVGNSPSEYFIGPETPGHNRSMEDPANPEDEPFKYKDDSGRVKRQVPRFRVYAYDGNNASKGYDEAEPMRELNLDDDEVESITWHVELANKKGSWYQFKGLFNINQHLLRNPAVEDRASLDITPGPRTISGANVNTGEKSEADFSFDTGSFLGYNVYLGELRTDEKGRLLVFGGHGHSYKTPEGAVIKQYANNDYWYDDTSGGPIGVTVVLKDGSIFTSDPATLSDEQKRHPENLKGTVPHSTAAFAPPKYAPEVYPLVTLYDVMTDVAIKNNYLGARPSGCNFYRDVYPILKSGVDMDWVNNYASIGHSHTNGMTRDLLGPDNIAKLNGSKSRREMIFQRIRKPLSLADQELALEQAQPTFMPKLSGNNGDSSPGRIHTFLSVTEHQYHRLEQWIAGDFVVGQPPLLTPYLDASEHKADVADPYPKVVPIGEQPKALDRATLEPCIGGAFFPGIEITYICMSQDTYCDAYRINPYNFGAGDVGRYMALPWQADFFECMDHWWPTQRPDDVVPEEQYNLLSDKSTDWEMNRVKWTRGLRPVIAQDHASIHAGDMDMVDDWWKLGFVVPKTGKYGAVQVETERDYKLLSPWPENNHPSQQ